MMTRLKSFLKIMDCLKDHVSLNDFIMYHNYYNNKNHDYHNVNSQMIIIIIINKWVWNDCPIKPVSD